MSENNHYPPTKVCPYPPIAYLYDKNYLLKISMEEIESNFDVWKIALKSWPEERKKLAAQKKLVYNRFSAARNRQKNKNEKESCMHKLFLRKKKNKKLTKSCDTLKTELEKLKAENIEVSKNCNTFKNKYNELKNSLKITSLIYPEDYSIHDAFILKNDSFE